MIERGVHVAPGAHVGSLVVLGENVRVGPGSTVERSVILAGPRSVRAARCVTASSRPVSRRRSQPDQGGAVLGEGVTVGADNVITHGARIFPGVDLPDEAIKF